LAWEQNLSPQIAVTESRNVKTCSTQCAHFASTPYLVVKIQAYPNIPLVPKKEWNNREEYFRTPPKVKS